MVARSSDQAVAALCPDCDEDILLQGTIRIGRRVACPNCGADLEIVETEPVELDWYYEEEYEDEEDEEDE